MYLGNPFRHRAPAHYNVEFFETCDIPGRLRLVREFSVAECVAALRLAGLQKTVHRAIERRLTQLTHSAHAQTPRR